MDQEQRTCKLPQLWHKTPVFLTLCPAITLSIQYSCHFLMCTCEGETNTCVHNLAHTKQCSPQNSMQLRSQEIFFTLHYFMHLVLCALYTVDLMGYQFFTNNAPSLTTIKPFAGTSTCLQSIPSLPCFIEPTMFIICYHSNLWLESTIVRCSGVSNPTPTCWLYILNMQPDFVTRFPNILPDSAQQRNSALYTRPPFVHEHVKV